MRTTLTLDSDVAKRLQDEMRRRGKPLKVVVNDGLRAGLGRGAEAGAIEPFKVQPLELRLRPGFDPDKLGQLLDELDAEEFAARNGR